MGLSLKSKNPAEWRGYAGQSRKLGGKCSHSFPARFDSALQALSHALAAKELCMSIEAVAWALKQEVFETLPNGKKVAKHTAKLVLIALANHHNESTGECYPSKKKLMEAACCSEKTAERCLQWLEAEGWIKRVPGYTEKGRRTSNTYLINRDKFNGGQLDPLPQPVRGTSRRRPAPVKLTPSTSLNHKNKPSASRSENFSPRKAAFAEAPEQTPEERARVKALFANFTNQKRM
jgi:hypothetical protein